jgi:predicted nucleic acid-binding protein
VAVSARPDHRAIFRRVVTAADARGSLVPDAHLAAIAIEHGATIATRDRGFARFGDARWLDPVA